MIFLHPKGSDQFRDNLQCHPAQLERNSKFSPNLSKFTAPWYLLSKVRLNHLEYDGYQLLIGMWRKSKILKYELDLQFRSQTANGLACAFFKQATVHSLFTINGNVECSMFTKQQLERQPSSLSLRSKINLIHSPYLSTIHT